MRETPQMGVFQQPVRALNGRRKHDGWGQSKGVLEVFWGRWRGVVAQHGS
jgi:hypothetical protein